MHRLESLYGSIVGFGVRSAALRKLFIISKGDRERAYGATSCDTSMTGTCSDKMFPQIQELKGH